MKISNLVARLGFGVSLAVAAGCGAAADSPQTDGADEGRAQSGDRIIGGTLANGYPEAVLVDMYQGGQLQAYCSGTLIAPKVVLTAGHCVFQFDSWKITAPFAGKQSVMASSGTTYDWQVTSESVDGTVHDVGLIFLDGPISLSSYPTLATSGLASGSKIVNVGRINSGSLSTTSLYVSSGITVKDGASSGFPFDYEATDKIESGDSGGGDFAYGTHTIVSVNSGAGGGTEVLARVDLLSSWIAQQVDAHGGNGSQGGGTGGGGGGTTTGGGPTGGGNSCAHDICEAGKKLTASCDSCASSICDQDPYCCNTKWDSVCVGEVASICGQTCN